MWYVTTQKHGASTLGLQRVLGLGQYRTAWTWLHKLRRAMARPGRERLAGSVEADEIYVGGKELGARGRSLGKKAVAAVAVEENGAGMGRIRLERVPNAAAARLEDSLLEAVEPGSTIRTDGWTSYSRLQKLGYRHNEAVMGGGRELVERALPRVHRVAALLKRWPLGTHPGAVEHRHMDYYLDELTFRFNRRTSRSRGLLFYRLLQQAVATAPVPRKATLGGSPAPTDRWEKWCGVKHPCSTTTYSGVWSQVPSPVNILVAGRD